MKNVRLLTTTAGALLALSLLWTGCGQPPATDEGDAATSAHDAAKPASDGAVASGDADTDPMIDAAVASPDAGTVENADGATVEGDAGPGTSDAQATSTDGSVAGGDASISTADTGAASADASAQGPDAGSVTCQRLPKAADRPRKVVLGHPYDVDGNAAKVYDILDMSESGVITQPNPRVKVVMSRAYDGHVVFTPDGEIALVAQDDGTVGELRFDAAGNATVLQTGWKDQFWADQVVMDPSGERFYVLDSNWKNNGGGITSVKIGCDGTLTREGMLFQTQNVYALDFVASRPNEALVHARKVPDDSATTDLHLFAWGASPALTASTNAFPDDQAIVPGARFMPDGKWALVADNQAYPPSPNPNLVGQRVAAVPVLASGFGTAQQITPFSDLNDVIPSPHGNAALLISCQGNAFYTLSYDSTNASPFGAATKMTLSPKPQLPTTGVTLDRGTLKGRAFIAELSGIRQIQFNPDGSVTDLGLTEFLADLESITGAMGVQP